MSTEEIKMEECLSGRGDVAVGLMKYQVYFIGEVFQRQEGRQCCFDEGTYQFI